MFSASNSLPRLAVHAAVAVVLLAPDAVSAQGTAEGLAIERYEVQLDLLEGGAYEVLERLVFTLEGGTFSFGSRRIPTRRLDRIRNPRVASPDLSGLESSVEWSNGNRVVRWEHDPDPAGGTVEIRYRVEGALLDEGETNEIFWAAVGSDVELPVEAVGVRVTLPRGFAAGPDELTVDPEARISSDDDRWILDFEHGALDEGQAWQLRVAFPRRLDGRRTGLRDPRVQVAFLGVLLMFLGLGVGVRGRERWIRGPVEPASERPELELPEAAVLLYPSEFAETALPAVVVDLARRGHLTLAREAPDEEDAGPADRPVARLRLHPSQDDPLLTDFEQTLLQDLEPYESLQEFGSEASELRSRRMADVRRRMIDDGWLVDLTRERRSDMWRGLGLLVVAVLLPLAVVLGGASPWLIAVSMGGLGLAIGLMVRGEQRLLPTPEARRVQARLRGWLRGVRRDIERELERDPVRAARRYIDALPWLTIDPEHHHQGALQARLRKELEESHEDLPVPRWVEDRWEEQGEAREELDRHSSAYGAFHSTCETTAITAAAIVPLLASSGLGGTGVPGAGISVAGAGGAGAAGGGGVSAG